MKKLKISIPVFVFLIAVMLLGQSCKKSFYTNPNTNTNSPDPNSIIPSVMLSTVEGTLAYAQGGDFSRYTSLITQQTFGSGRQAQGYYGYVFTSVDFDSPWGNFYTSVLENDKTLMQLSDAKGDNAYGGISRILLAYSLQMGVDMWGSIPYSKALQGALNLQATYDTDKGLYDTIAGLITSGIAKLGATVGPDKPGAEDVVFGGTASNWIKFAHAIRARLYIHQSKGNATMATNALAEIAQSFTSNADNAVYIFGSTETSANPWYQFNEQRNGDIAYTNSTLGLAMAAKADPRYPMFIDSTLNDVNGVGMGPYYGNISSPVEFITYDELLFMKAEATLTSGGTVAAAQPYFYSAITHNMAKLGVDTTKPAAITYLAANGTLPVTSAAAISAIGAQAYIALYLNPEAFTTWRRTNSPTLTPVVGTAVPRRFLYPQTEYSYNGKNIPGTTTLFSPKVFWDN